MTTAPRAGRVIGVDAGTATLRDADHLAHRLSGGVPLPDGAFVCTHPVRDGGRPRIGVTVTLPGAVAPGPVRERLAALTPGVLPDPPSWPGGRAVVFPGAARLTGTVALAELTARTAIDRVALMGDPAGPPPGARLATRDHVRPEWRDGLLVLTVMPAAGGVLVPFEVPDPTPCCAGH